MLEKSQAIPVNELKYGNCHEVINGCDDCLDVIMNGDDIYCDEDRDRHFCHKCGVE